MASERPKNTCWLRTPVWPALPALSTAFGYVTLARPNQ